MKIKVLNITEEGRGGGPLKRIRNVAKRLYDHDIHTIVLFPNKNSEEFKELLEKDQVEHLQIPLHRLTKEKSTLLKYVITFWKEVYHIMRIIKKEKIDIVHANGAWQVKGILAAKLSGIQSVWHMNDSFQADAVKQLFKLFAPLATNFIYAAEKTKKYYQAINPTIKKKPDILIQAPVDTIKFHSDAESPQKAEKILNGDGYKLLTVGYVNPNKGFETLLHAMNELKACQTQLYIVGTIFDSQKAYHKKLKNLIKEYQLANVHFLGYRSDVKDLLHAADIYVCSSDFEASPISVWEALSSGIPVVSTDVGDVREIFEEEECGLVVESQNPEQLAKGISDLIKDKEKQSKYRINGRRTAEKLFSLDAVVLNHQQFYSQIHENGQTT